MKTKLKWLFLRHHILRENFVQKGFHLVILLLRHHKVPGILELLLMKPYLWLTTNLPFANLQTSISETWRLDYANATLFGLPSCQLNRLQRILNNAARLVTLSSRDYISDITYNLHWLPIKQRIDFKILLLTVKALNNNAPSYIKELLKQYNPTRTLRSSDGFSLFQIQSTEPQVTDPFLTVHLNFGTICQLK